MKKMIKLEDYIDEFKDNMVKNMTFKQLIIKRLIY